MPAPLKLIVGLGNPGARYAMTRHNAGFWFIDALAARFSVDFSADRKFHSELGRYRSGPVDCRLCKPQTFMNESGTAVSALLGYYKLPLEQVLIVHDEIDLAPGNVRFKIGGGHGGNNGLRDIIGKTGHKGFNRLRIGVGHPGSADRVLAYVLARPAPEHEQAINNGIRRVLDEHEKLFAGQIQDLMNLLNERNKPAVGQASGNGPPSPHSGLPTAGRRKPESTKGVPGC